MDMNFKKSFDLKDFDTAGHEEEILDVQYM